ncbi:MAG: lipid-A-disaccharide synthase [Fimbriimonadaceae bacterium]
MRRILFSAGEASGDAYAAAILAETEAVGAAWERVDAVGGPKLRQAGAEIIADSSHWGALGIVESLKTVPLATRGYWSTVRLIERSEPGLFVPVDFGFFNIKLARRAKRWGWKVLYFAPPSSWRRDKQGADLPSVTDVIVTPFPWSAEILQRNGADARFLGHPLLDLVRSHAQTARGDSVAVLPGSRIHEVKANFSVACAAVRRTGRPIIVGLAPSLQPSVLGRLGPDVTIVRSSHEALARSSAAVVCSGTATLEAALLNCPQVVIYRGSWIMELESRIRKPQFDFISLPNIVLQRQAVPELLQHDASEEAIASHLVALLTDVPARSAQLDAFAAVKAELEPAGCIRATARLCLALLPD